MNGELAQVVALVAYGSRWLATPEGAPPPNLEQNSTFQYVGQLRFSFRPARRFARVVTANTTSEWFEQLKRRGAQRLSLCTSGAIPPLLAGFAGAPWGLASRGHRGAELWRTSWSVGDRDAADHRIWTVEYAGEPSLAALPVPEGVAEATARLTKALEDIRAFAAGEQTHEAWVTWFDDALRTPDEIPYHLDMLPSDWDPGARRLAAAAAKSWVFGGMGSWNDGWPRPEVQAEYERVSNQLYSAVLVSLAASANVV